MLIKKKTEVVKGFVAKTGMMFNAPLKLTEDGQVTFDFPEKPKPVETSVKCPKCQKKLRKARWNYECECGFKVSHTVAKVELSEEVMKELLETGKTTNKVIGFTSKAGNVFDACLKFEDDRISFDFGNPGSSSGDNSVGEEARPFYEELDNKPISVEMSVYDAMAAEYAAYNEQYMQEQNLEDKLLGDSFLFYNE